MSVIFLFVDGVGLGKYNTDNPLTANEWNGLLLMSRGQPFSSQADPVLEEEHVFKPVEATLGVEGLPQSGTGQATLFSGENAAKEIGKHFGPFPHSGNKHLLREQSIFHKAQRKGKRCKFVNAYPDVFFTKAEARDRWTCTTLMTKSADIQLCTAKDIQEGNAITAGITQTAWRNHLSIDVPVISPETAANRLINQSVSNDLVLYEYYLTDKAGHGRTEGKTIDIIDRYDRFLASLIQSKPRDVTIVLCSDHGNLEDLSVKTHTRNDVPLVVIGPGAGTFKNARSILDITPGILSIL